MNKFYLYLVAGCLFCFTLVPSASEQPPELLADVWVFTAKTGQLGALQKALVAHRDHRRQLGDPRKWRLYQPIVGNQLDSFLVRYCCFEWAELDSYQQWMMEKQPMQHWVQQVEPHVQHSVRYLSELDVRHSNWPADLPYRYVGVTRYMVKPGHWRAMSADVKTLTEIARTHSWPYHYGWMYGIGGEPRVYLASPYNSYAEMARPEQSFAELLIKHFGDEQKATQFMQNWAEHFHSIHYDIYVFLPDMSM